MKRRGGIEIVCDVLVAVADPKNENIPNRILFASRLNPSVFTRVVTLVEKEHLIQVLHNARDGPGSRNKFLIADKGRYFIELYRKAISLLGDSDNFLDRPVSELFRK